MKHVFFSLKTISVSLFLVLLAVGCGKNDAKPADKHDVKHEGLSKSGHLPIAYINVDSLLIHYQFAKDANESLTRKQEDSRLRINMQARQLQQEMAEFNKKLENNAFLSRERAEQEQARLAKKQQDLQALDGKLSQQLIQEQQKMSEQLRDTINKFLKEYNKDRKYELIISNTANDNILYAADGYDITNDVIKLLNERCGAKK